MWACDGNNSARRVLSAGTKDPRVFNSDYFLSRDTVDRFANEVKRRAPDPAELTLSQDVSTKFIICIAPHRLQPDIEEEVADSPWVPAQIPSDADTQGDVTDGASKSTPCTQRWKASASEHQKRALAVYDTTGIFASACRHGFILKVTEMVRSGEL